MRIHNEVTTVQDNASLFTKQNGKKFVKFSVLHTKRIRTSKGARNLTSVYEVRCYGELFWLNQILEKAKAKEKVLISGDLEQRNIKTDKGNLPITVLTVTNPNDLNFYKLGVAS